MFLLLLISKHEMRRLVLMANDVNLFKAYAINTSRLS